MQIEIYIHAYQNMAFFKGRIEGQFENGSMPSIKETLT